MTWDFKDGRPLYIQIMEQVKLGIISGEYAFGAKLPSVRELAEEASVNPNTVQKALTELERDGLVYSQRTSGRFITEDAELVGRIKEGLAGEQIDMLFGKMGAIGYTREDTARIIANMAKGDE